MGIMRTRNAATRWVVLSAWAVALAAHADVDLPSGASWSQNDGQMDLGGADLSIAGQVDMASGQLTGIKGLTINPGGQINAGSGKLGITGAWSNNGAFNAGTSQVEFTDGNSANGAVSGNTQFHHASFVSTSGKTWRFGAGSTQSFGGSLTILGTSAAPIQIASSQAGQVAYLNLLPAGTQQIHYVGVSDVYASGLPLASGETNQGGTGNALGWFDVALAAIQQVPALSNLALGLLGALLFTLTYFRRTRTAQKI